MKKICCMVLVSLLVLTLFLTPAQCRDCTSISTSSVKGNCVVREWTVCCGGPGPGEVSCFQYTETVYCAPIID